MRILFCADFALPNNPQFTRLTSQYDKIDSNGSLQAQSEDRANFTESDILNDLTPSERQSFIKDLIKIDPTKIQEMFKSENTEFKQAVADALLGLLAGGGGTQRSVENILQRRSEVLQKFLYNLDGISQEKVEQLDRINTNLAKYILSSDPKIAEALVDKFPSEILNILEMTISATSGKTNYLEVNPEITINIGTGRTNNNFAYAMGAALINEFIDIGKDTQTINRAKNILEQFPTDNMSAINLKEMLEESASDFRKYNISQKLNGVINSEDVDNMPPDVLADYTKDYIANLNTDNPIFLSVSLNDIAKNIHRLSNEQKMNIFTQLLKGYPDTSDILIFLAKPENSNLLRDLSNPPKGDITKVLLSYQGDETALKILIGTLTPQQKMDICDQLLRDVTANPPKNQAVFENLINNTLLDNLGNEHPKNINNVAKALIWYSQVPDGDTIVVKLLSTLTVNQRIDVFKQLINQFPATTVPLSKLIASGLIDSDLSDTQIKNDIAKTLFEYAKKHSENIQGLAEALNNGMENFNENERIILLGNINEYLLGLPRNAQNIDSIDTIIKIELPILGSESPSTTTVGEIFEEYTQTRVDASRDAKVASANSSDVLQASAATEDVDAQVTTRTASTASNVINNTLNKINDLTDEQKTHVTSGVEGMLKNAQLKGKKSEDITKFVTAVTTAMLSFSTDKNQENLVAIKDAFSDFFGKEADILINNVLFNPEAAYFGAMLAGDSCYGGDIFAVFNEIGTKEIANINIHSTKYGYLAKDSDINAFHAVKNYNFPLSDTIPDDPKGALLRALAGNTNGNIWSKINSDPYLKAIALGIMNSNDKLSINNGKFEIKIDDQLYEVEIPQKDNDNELLFKSFKDLVEYYADKNKPPLGFKITTNTRNTASPSTANAGSTIADTANSAGGGGNTATTGSGTGK